MTKRFGISKPTYRTGTSISRRPGFVRSAQTSSEAGSRASQVPHQVREGQPGVDDVLDDEDVAALDRDVEVLEDAHDARGVGRRRRSSRSP